MILRRLLPGVLAWAAVGLALPAGDAVADVLELKDGRVVEGLAVQDGDVWHVASRFGVVTLRAGEVARHLAGPSLDAQIEETLGRLASDDLDRRMELATWLVDVGRADEARALATTALELDPEHAAAHGVLGHVRHEGRWMTPDDAQRARGLERHGERWYTPEEWRHVDEAARAAVLQEEVGLQARAREEEVRQLVDLLVSPDPALRRRAQARLRELARAEGVGEADVQAALSAADELVRRAREVRTQALGGVAAPGAVAGGRDGGWMTAEIRDDFSRLRRPIREFATSLASSFAPVRIMLPEMQLVSVRTTVAVPLVPSLQPSR